jgi:hypothetical protein
MRSKAGIFGFVVATVAVAALCRLVMVAAPDRSPKRSVDRQTEQPSSVEGKNAERIEDMQSRIRDLETDLARQSALLARDLAEQGSSAAPLAASAGEGGAMRPAPTAPMRSPTSREIVDQIDARFYPEPRTPWGASAAARATAALSGLVRDGRIGQIECRETMCRIELTHDSLQAFSNFAHQLASPQVAEALWNGGFSAQVTNQSPGAVSSVVFYAREDHEIPPAEDVPE